MTSHSEGNFEISIIIGTLEVTNGTRHIEPVEMWFYYKKFRHPQTAIESFIVF